MFVALECDLDQSNEKSTVFGSTLNIYKVWLDSDTNMIV